jgi:hypothetical protein
MAGASAFTAAGLSGKDDVPVAAAGVSSFPVSPALRARSGEAARLIPSKTVANTRISFPPENEVLYLVAICKTELGMHF